MKILVTGAAGFIGSHLVDALLDEGHTVKGLDDFSYGDLENLSKARQNAKFELIKGSILSYSDIDKALGGVECIFHLAAFKIPRYTDALETLRVNGIGSFNILEECGKRGIRIIAASTSDAYGLNSEVPFSENNTNSVIGSPKVRRWAYAVSKMFEEQLGFAIRERYAVKTTLVRFFGGYGPRHNLTWWGGPQSGFITRAINGEPLEIHGDGLQTRSFTYISDHIAGLIGILNHEETDGEILNLGNTEEVTIAGLANIIWKLIRKDEPIFEFIPYSSFGKYEDVRRRVPDLSLSEKIIRFKPLISLEAGLKKTIEWQKEKLGL